MSASISPFKQKRTVGSAVFLDLTDEAKTDRLTYPISTDYVKEWTAVRAMSELVANAIDEDPTGYSVTWENGCLIIEDNGRGISEHGHLMGHSAKGDDAIGQFGEGKIVGSLVLARNKNIGRILFETVDYSFEPTIVRANLLSGSTRKQQSRPTMAPELLAMDFYPSDRTRGTRITIECDVAFLEKVKSRFLHFRPGYIPNTNDGSILTDEPGKIYIGGVLVKDDSDCIFGYDLPLSAMKKAQNRDRNVIDGYLLSSAVNTLWSKCEDDDTLKAWLTGFLKGSLKNNAEKTPFGNMTAPQRLKMRNLLKIVAGSDKLYFLDGYQTPATEQVDKLKAKGYKKIAVRGNNWYCKRFLLNIGVKGISDVLPKKKTKPARARTVTPFKDGETQWISERKLTQQEKDIRDKAIDQVKGLFGKKSVGKVRIYLQTRRVTSFPGSWNGFYDEQTKTIAIHRYALNSVESFFNAMLSLVAQKKSHSVDPWQRAKYTAEQLITNELHTMLNSAVSELRKLDGIKGASQKAAAKEKTPAGVVRALVKRQMAVKGYKNAVAMEAATAVKIDTLRKLQAGKSITALQELEAACNALDLHWSVVFLGLQSQWLGDARRIKSGRLYGSTHTQWVLAEKHLRTLGNDYAKLADKVSEHGTGKTKTPLDKTDWQNVYYDLLKLQAKEL